MESTAQLFMGTRVQCAKCHDHPFERWTQSNYYGLASFFNRIERRKTDRPKEVILWSRSSGEVQHPTDGRMMKPWVPVTGDLEIAAAVDRRAALAEWLTAPDLQPHDRSKPGDVDFLKVFGQPERQSVCECDRGDDSSLGQALELLNGSFINNLLTNGNNRLHQYVRLGRSTRGAIIKLYRLALSRYPSESELNHRLVCAEGHADKPRALEDICWAIVNKDEFLFQH